MAVSRGVGPGSRAPAVALLVSDNPYHLSTLRHLGRRFTLGAGLLGPL